MSRFPLCEADTYTGTVCGVPMTTNSWDREPVCRYAASHLGTHPEPFVQVVAASPGDRYYPIGFAVLTATTTYHEMSQYPGADRFLSAEPQRVMLTSNGYWCAYRVSAVVTGRGYYGGAIGVTETYVAQPYAYDVVAALRDNEGVARCATVRYELADGVGLKRVVKALPTSHV